jgi:hypothetical protein
MNKIGLTVMTISLVLIMAAISGSMIMIGDAKAGGFSDGKQQAREDSQSGTHNDHCGYENTLSYCAAYRLGYEAGWGAEALLHDR